MKAHVRLTHHLLAICDQAMTKHSLYVLLLCAGVLMPSSGAALTGEITNNPADIVKKYVKLDSKGARLYSESQETLHPYTTWTEEPSWGTVVVIKEHMVLDHTQHWEIISMLEAKIPVEYRVLGTMHWASATFSVDPRVERVQYHVIGRAHRWRILGPQIPPHVGVTRVISFVRHAILQETDPKRRETLAALRDSLKEAR